VTTIWQHCFQLLGTGLPFGFLRQDFAILAFVNTFSFFGNQKRQTKSGFFWLSFNRKGLVLEKHCLSSIFIANIFCRVYNRAGCTAGADLTLG